MILFRIVAMFLVPSNIEWDKYIKSYIDYPINIKSTKFSFTGWYPIVDLQGVDILTENRQLALTVDHVQFVLNPYAFLFKRVELKDLIVEGMKIRVHCDLQTGRVWLADLPNLKWDLTQTKEPNKIAIKHLRIKESDFHLIIDKNKSLPLAEVDLQMGEGFPTRIYAQALVLNEPASSLQLTIDVPIFGKNIAKFYGRWEKGSVEQIAKLWDHTLPSQLTTGLADLKVWGSIDKKGKKDFVSEITLSDDNDAIIAGTGWIKAHGKDRDWKIAAHWEQKGEAQPFEGFLNTYRSEKGQYHYFQTGNIELGKMMSKFSLFTDEEPSILTWMKKFEVQGLIDSLAFSVIQDEKNIIPISSAVAFKNLGCKAGEKHPGIQGLSGKFSYQNDKMRLLLDSQDVVIDYEKAFLMPLVIKNLQAQWGALPTEDTRIHGVISTLQIADTVFSGNISFDQQKGKIHNVDLEIEGKEWAIQEALALLPRKVMDKMLVEWLDNALQEGNIKQSILIFKGDPKNFPFDKKNGLFEAKLALENTKLHYDPDWPMLENLNANLMFRNREMLIDAEQAVIANGPLLATKAVITDITAPIVVLDLNAKLQNQLPQAMQVIEKSPLNDSIGKSLAALQFQGGFDLDLGLTIPLTKKSGFPVKVNGKMKLDDAQVKVPDWKLQADHVKGVVLFSEKSVLAENLTGKMLNHPTAFSIATGSENQPDFQIKIQGGIGLTDLEKWLTHLDYQCKTDFISGNTNYIATLDVSESKKNQPLVLKIQTNLDGIEVKTPPPFGKEAKTVKASSFSLEWKPHELAQLTIEYGDETSAAVRLKIEGKDWRFQGGHINLGALAKAKMRDDGILLVDGQIDEFDVSAWKNLFQKGPENTLSFEPLIALNIHKLMFENEIFSKTQVEAQWDKVSKIWNFNFNGPSLKGHVVLPEGDDQREIVIDLKKLTVMTSNEHSSFESMERKIIQRPIEAKIKKLKVNGKALTDFEARIEPSWKGYDVPRLQVKLKNTDVSLSGQWDVLLHTRQVTAEGKILTRNTTDLFKTLGMTGTVHHAKGNIDFSVQWRGTPIKIDYPSLTGKAAFRLTNGYVQGVDPGIGRVLNLLSLDTIQRRLSLDFSDVTKKGFAFDEFMGAFQFGKGKVSSNKVSLQGPSANIQSYGQADLQNQEVNGMIIVMPNVTGSLPVVAAIAAGNPAVGAAVWLVDKMVGKKLQEIHRYHYRLVGTWDAPKLEGIDSLPMSRG